MSDLVRICWNMPGRTPGCVTIGLSTAVTVCADMCKQFGDHTHWLLDDKGNPCYSYPMDTFNPKSELFAIDIEDLGL